MHTKIHVLIICVFISLLSFQLSAQPLPPVIDSISVNHQSKLVELAWTPPAGENIDGYIIIRQVFNCENWIDGKWRDVITFTDNSIQFTEDTSQVCIRLPFEAEVSYRIRTFQGNVQNTSVDSEIHSTIFLSPIEFDSCQVKTVLKWTPYIGWGNNLTKYEIYAKIDNSINYQYITEVSATTVQFEHFDITENQTYQYFIRAINVDGIKSSSSNYAEVYTKMPRPVQILNADYTIVENNAELKLSFTIDNAAQIKEYCLLRAPEINANFDTIARFDNSSSPIETSDFFPVTDSIYYYKLSVINSCNIEYKQSNISHNILLHAEAAVANPGINNLEWNSYQGWASGVEKYAIFRSVDFGTPELIQVITNGTSSYQDDISSFQGSSDVTEGNFCYYVEATENIGNQYNIIGVSQSNTACTAQLPEIYIPNAFNPYSMIEENRVFKPLLSFASDYQMIIFDRWGGKIFETNDMYEGWNGKIREGKYAKEGVYIYFISFKSAENKDIVKKGTVALVY